MRRKFRVALKLVGIIAAILCLSFTIRGKLTDAGQQTEIRVGAFSPWIEYVKAPGHTRLQVNILSWSMLFGVIALGCMGGLQRLPAEAKPDTSAVNHSAEAR